MKKVLFKKLVSAVLVIALLTVVVFMIVRLLPGDPVTVMLGTNATPEAYDALTKKFNLDKPIFEQYWLWIKDVLRGNWGTSLNGSGEVMPQVLERFPRSFLLCVTSTIFSLMFSIPLGVITAAKRDTKTDMIISSGSLLIISVPEFWLGILLMILLSVMWGILPAGGYVKPNEGFVPFLKSIIMPTVALGLATAPTTLRLVRSSMVEVLDEDYIMLAHTKGCSEHRVNYVHALRNSLIPIATTVTMNLASLLAGVIIIEKVFSYPGLGQFLMSSINRRDYPAIQAAIFMFSIVVVLSNLVCDLIYILIDPRIRVE